VKYGSLYYTRVYYIPAEHRFTKNHPAHVISSTAKTSINQVFIKKGVWKLMRFDGDDGVAQQVKNEKTVVV
jgi:hypothetical protein